MRFTSLAVLALASTSVLAAPTGWSDNSPKPPSGPNKPEGPSGHDAPPHVPSIPQPPKPNKPEGPSGPKPPSGGKDEQWNGTLNVMDSEIEGLFADLHRPWRAQWAQAAAVATKEPVPAVATTRR